MKQEILKKAQQWATDHFFDEATRKEIATLLDNNAEDELEDRFYRTLDFGTGGLRGVMEAGTNRMNVYTVRLATQGLANYLLGIPGAAQKGVVIAYDSRRSGEAFSIASATVLAANGIKVHLFNSLRPVPELSFAVIHLRAIAGVCITASHNPPEYNGYKVFFEDGAQITPPHDRLIIEAVNRIDDFSLIRNTDFVEARNAGLIGMIGSEVDECYFDALLSQSINEAKDNIVIVYTPLHGAGIQGVPPVLARRGFTRVIAVKEQMEPDGRFPTVASPNPEEEASLTLALQYARQANADIMLATDPDCDRIAVAARSLAGELVPFNGNQTAALLTDYILSGLSLQGKLHKDRAVVVKTIVTTDLIRQICDDYRVRCVDLLTGFKYIGEWIAKNPHLEFLFGCEESYGYLRGTYARDKDAVVAASLIAEAASVCKRQSTTLHTRLQELYERYGYFLESLYMKKLEGRSGAQRISFLMDTLRTATTNPLSSFDLVELRDYLKDRYGLPLSNVLAFLYRDGSKMTVRPSGTEPKIKIYFSVKGTSQREAQEKLREMENSFEEWMERV